MKLRIAHLRALIVVALVFGSFASADDAPALRKNPFARPPSERTAPVAFEARGEGTTQELDLRATLVGSRERLANVDGKTVRPGDEIQGYKVVQVFEDRAVFAREGSRLTVFVKPELEENDEQ